VKTAFNSLSSYILLDACAHGINSIFSC